MEHRTKRQRFSEVQDLDPDQYKSKIRESTRQTFERHTENKNIENYSHLVWNVQAILTTNSEIWDRCTKSLDPIPAYFTKGDKLCFKRLGYKNVEVGSAKDSDKKSCVKFTTALSLETKDYDKPPSIPSDLTEIFSVVQKSDAMFPDYDRFLESLLLLHDDVLSSFLLRLKDHLEDVQVYLGTIESWIMESTRSVQFIEEVFQVKIDSPQNKIRCNGCQNGHPPTSICLRCLETFQEHIQREHETLNCESRLQANTAAGHYCFDSAEEAMFCLSCPQTLGCYNITGIFDYSFNLETSEGRKSLKDFLKFVSNVHLAAEEKSSNAASIALDMAVGTDKATNCGVAKISVVGAGSSVANGTYIHESVINGACCYSKAGKINGNLRKLSIILYGNEWLLVGYSEDDNLFDTYLYSAPKTYASQHVAPNSGWRERESGLYPAPFIRYTSLDNEEDQIVDVKDAVLSFIRGESNSSELGVEVALCLQVLGPTFTIAAVRRAIDDLASGGNIYSTINEDFYKYAM